MSVREAVPGDRSLVSVLATVFSNGSSLSTPPELLDRRPNSRSSTFESEIVTCRLADGGERTLLCKHERFCHPNPRGHDSWGHRRGHRYEADVYRRVLEPMRAAAPRYFEVHSDSETGASFLLLEYLGDAHHPRGDAEWLQVATWLARFHRDFASFASSPDGIFLTRYDREYYRGWARRTSEFAKPLVDRYPWVGDVCARFAERGASLLETGPVVIHGEFYFKNLLVREGQVYPVDWESCAVGAAEIDLAMLLENCADEIVDAVTLEYMRQRWSRGVTEQFIERVSMATVYMHLRWLGDHANLTRVSHKRFRALQAASERAGLLRER